MRSWSGQIRLTFVRDIHHSRDRRCRARAAPPTPLHLIRQPPPRALSSPSSAPSRPRPPHHPHALSSRYLAQMPPPRRSPLCRAPAPCARGRCLTLPARLMPGSARWEMQRKPCWHGPAEGAPRCPTSWNARRMRRPRSDPPARPPRPARLLLLQASGVLPVSPRPRVAHRLRNELPAAQPDARKPLVCRLRVRACVRACVLGWARTQCGSRGSKSSSGPASHRSIC